MTPAILVDTLSHAYGRRAVLRDLDWSVPEGSLYALLGANAAGKSTLLRLVAGILPQQRGRIEVLGATLPALPRAIRQRIGYVAEGQQLPAWMRMADLEAYHAPLYPLWDHALATRLRDQFALDLRQRVGDMSRGQRMKAALLCALAPRPSLLIMDEPFTGLDVAVKDSLVRGLLETAMGEGCTVVISTHDIAEVELLADWIGFLRDGRVVRSTPLDTLRERFHRLHLTLAEPEVAPRRWPVGWLDVTQHGAVVSALVEHEGAPVTQSALGFDVTHLELHPASLKDVYLAIQQQTEEIA